MRLDLLLERRKFTMKTVEEVDCDEGEETVS